MEGGERERKTFSAAMEKRANREKNFKNRVSCCQLNGIPPGGLVLRWWIGEVFFPVVEEEYRGPF